MQYELIEGSELNCTVYLEEGGLLIVTPFDPNREYRFLYRETNSRGESNVCVWNNRIEMSPLSRLPDMVTPAYEDDEFYKRSDTNHKSTIEL